MMEHSVSEAGYAIINGIIRDFSAEAVSEFQQRVLDVATGIAIGMKKEGS